MKGVQRGVRGDGTKTYRVRWREGGRHRSKTFYTKRDAEHYKARVILRQRAPELVRGDGRETVIEFGQEWWERCVVGSDPPLAAATQDVYSRLWNGHVLPHLGSYRLAQLSPDVLEDWRMRMRREGVGRVSMARSMGLLAAVLNRAVEWERIPSAPRMRKPSQKRGRQITVIAPARVELMREFLTENLRHRDAALVSTLAYAGVRPGEARGLRWAYVADRLRIEWRMTAGGLEPSTKTGVDRAVRLLAPLAQDLAEWRDRTEWNGDSDFVFPARGGVPMAQEPYKAWGRKVFKRAAEAAGLPQAVPYDLRHSFASLLLQEGKQVVYVAKQLGHSPTECLKTYAHVMEELGDDPVPAEQAIWAARVPHRDHGEEERVRVAF